MKERNFSMDKSPVYCTGDPETCENCKSIKMFTDRLKKIRPEKISMLLPMYLPEEDKLGEDK
jgi:hypothetical protein